MGLKQDLHDRLWRSFERWQELREGGATKHELKMRGIREAGDPNRHTRNLVFTGNTLRSYEGVLKRFVDSVRAERPVGRLEEIGKKDFRAFMDRAISEGLAVKTLNRYRSALAKFGALTGQSASFAALSQKYGWKVRQLGRTGQLPSPTRMTPSREVVHRAVAIMKARDAVSYARTGQPRAYHLAARLQLETSARSVSVTARFGPANVLEGHRVRIIGKGGKEQVLPVSPELHLALKDHVARNPGPLAGQRGYQSAYARAIRAAGGRVTGTHGARRRSAQDHYTAGYRSNLEKGAVPHQAASAAAGNTIERLGHSRNRLDHRAWYLGR